MNQYGDAKNVSDKPGFVDTYTPARDRLAQRVAECDNKVEALLAPLV